MAVVRSMLVRSNRIKSMCGSAYLAISVFVISINLFISSNLSADAAFQFHTIDKQQGLISSVVYDIAQDNDGFMWFATEDGLQKYDGFEFTSYRHNRLDGNSISSNVVRTLLVDSRGRIWVGTNSGLNLYQQKSDNFLRLNNQIQSGEIEHWNQVLSLSETSDGVIWIGSKSGLSNLSYDNKSFNNFPQEKVRTIFEDTHKQLWIGTLGSGLFLFDRNVHKFAAIKTVGSVQTEGSSISRKNIIDIYQDSSGIVLVATWGDGVFKVKNGSQKLVKYNLDLPTAFVKSILQDEKGHLWFGTNKGILVVDRLGQKSRLILADETSRISPNSDNVFKIFQGGDKIIWVGTYGGGVSRHNPASRKFESYGLHSNPKLGLSDPVTFALSEDQFGHIWVGSENGVLTEFDPETREFSPHDLALNGKKFNGQIVAIQSISEDNLLIGTQYGLFDFWKSNGVFEAHLDREGNHINGGEGVRFISMDVKGRIWIGFYDSGVKIFEVGSTNSLNLLETNSLKLVFPQAWFPLENNKYLVGTNNKGVYEISIDQGIWSQKKLPNTESLNVVDLTIDQQGKLWIAAWSKGIKIIQENGEFYSLDENSGMPNNAIYSIQTDSTTNKIWATTNLGMVAIDSEDYSITKYGFSDGMQGDEFNRPGILSRSGYLYFGGVNGFTKFYPSIIEQEINLRRSIISNLSIANEIVKISSDGSTPLEESLRVTEKITLDYSQTPFSIHFTSPQFVKPTDVQFRYRLSGLDDRWVKSDSSTRKATYTNIEPGSYTFELQARNINEEWGDEVVSKKVMILPPWWLTILAKLIYFIVASSIIFYIFYLNRQKRQSEIASLIMREKSEERLRLSLWGGGNELWDWDIVSGKVSRSDEDKSINIDCEMLTQDLAELDSYIHKFDVDRVKSQLSDHLKGVSENFDSTYRIKDGVIGWRWIQDRAKVVERDEKGKPIRMSGTQKDVSEMQRKNEEIERLGQAFKNTSDGVWIRDSEWRLIEVNPSFEKITGFTFEEKQGEELWFPDVGEQSTSVIQRVRLSLLEKGHWQGEIWAERKNKDPFPQKLTIDTILDDKGYASYYVGVFSDITFRKRAEEEFRKLANFDALTGLPNRACLYDRLNQTIDKTRIRRERFALFIVDIDNFKRINDSMGHGVGDTLIAEVAQRLTHCNRDGDTVARVGGDEFVIIRDDIYSSSEVASFAELMLKELQSPIFVKGQKLNLNYSIGITISPDDGTTAEKLLRNADTAMYEAKKDVQNSYYFFSVDLNKKARKRLSLENELRRTIELDLIDLVYQPKVNMQTGLVDGMEALARWNHPKLGFISPEEFVTLAEETGLILALGAQILRKAVTQTKEWVDLGMMKGRMSVNLSTHQFLHQDLTDQVDNVLKEVGLESKYLELELTESACMQDIDKTIDHMKSLRKIGVYMALDDFGTGYSSLGQLQTLPLDTLKVDKSFINNIENSEQEVTVVKAIIDIARSLDLEVVIEGVESRKQCDRLWQCRANIIQGYFFSKPVNGQLMTKLLEKKWEQSTYLSKISDNVRTLG